MARNASFKRGYFNWGHISESAEDKISFQKLDYFGDVVERGVDEDHFIGMYRVGSTSISNKR